MAVVDVEYEVYKCPHCDGIIVLRKQFSVMEMGCSISVEHLKGIPDYLKDEPIMDLEKDV